MKLIKLDGQKVELQRKPKKKVKLFDIAREIEVKRRAIEYRDLHDRHTMVKRMLSKQERKSKRKEQK